MILDTHCHFDMMPEPEAYIQEREKAGDIVIGMTNLPSHFIMGYPYVKSYKNIRFSLGMHPLLTSGNNNEVVLFQENVKNTSYIGEIGLDFSKDGITHANLTTYAPDRTHPNASGHKLMGKQAIKDWKLT